MAKNNQHRSQARARRKEEARTKAWATAAEWQKQYDALIAKGDIDGAVQMLAQKRTCNLTGL